MRSVSPRFKDTAGFGTRALRLNGKDEDGNALAPKTGPSASRDVLVNTLVLKLAHSHAAAGRIVSTDICKWPWSRD